MTIDLGEPDVDWLRQQKFDRLAQQFPVTAKNIANNSVTVAKTGTGDNGLAKGSFSVYRAAASTLATGAVIPFDTEEWDVSGWHDTVTNKGRFTPLVAGVYRLSAGCLANGVLAADTFWLVQLLKNGTVIKSGNIEYQRGAALQPLAIGSWLAQANGTTDYFEIGIAHNVGVAQAISVSQTATYFQGELVGRI